MLFKSKLTEIESAITNADSYKAYYEACQCHDELSGANDWKAVEQSGDYDNELIKKRVMRIKTARALGDADALISILHEGIHGNLGNIATPKLGQHAKLGTKKLIEDFLEQVCKALEFIYNANEDEIDFYQKLSFFEETTHAYGQSCLMLSGGAGLGFFHAGVVRALLEHDLVPDIVSGASAGAVIAALIGTRTGDDLVESLSAEKIYHYFNSWSQFRGLHKEGFFDSTNLENALIDLFGITTFEEAYLKTGVKMTVTVSPADLHQTSRLLNAKASPNAIITQAVRASCAIPYIFSPVYLKAKNPQGEVIPYIPNRQFADGSLMADLPFDRLARLYGVNHSIVSQTNPLAGPFLTSTKKTSGSLSELTISHLTHMAKKNSVYLFDVLEKLTASDYLKRGIHKVRSIVDQQYVGDINILPKQSFSNMKQIFANPSMESLNGLINEAERATWPKIDVIKRNTKISKTFNKYLKLLKKKESDLLKSNSSKSINNRATESLKIK